VHCAKSAIILTATTQLKHLLTTCIHNYVNIHKYKLTLWRPLLPYGYRYTASCARPV